MAKPSYFSLKYICVSRKGFEVFCTQKGHTLKKYKVHPKGLVSILPSYQLELCFANVSTLEVIPLFILFSSLFLRFLF